MKAFMPYTSDFWELAQEAGRRMMEFGGVTHVDYIYCRSKSACHKAKMETWLDYKEPVVMGDSDWWMVRSVQLPKPVDSFTYGSPNDSGVEVYEGSCVPPRSALCSALIGLDMGFSANRKAILQGIKLQARDYGRDEVYLNLALFSQPELCVMRLSNHWNWTGAPVKETIAIHAAGRSGKLEWLKTNLAKLSG